MELKDVIEVLTHYDIKQIQFPSNLLLPVEKDNVFGICHHNGRCIYINNEQDLMATRESVIHELIHAHLRIIGKKEVESQVVKETARIIKKLYGLSEID